MMAPGVSELDQIAAGVEAAGRERVSWVSKQASQVHEAGGRCEDERFVST
jgi:hypothetical protein